MIRIIDRSESNKNLRACLDNLKSFDKDIVFRRGGVRRRIMRCLFEYQIGEFSSVSIFHGGYLKLAASLGTQT